jgi:hypothetical protein
MEGQTTVMFFSNYKKKACDRLKRDDTVSSFPTFLLECLCTSEHTTLSLVLVTELAGLLCARTWVYSTFGRNVGCEQAQQSPVIIRNVTDGCG